MCLFSWYENEGLSWVFRFLKWSLQEHFDCRVFLSAIIILDFWQNFVVYGEMPPAYVWAGGRNGKILSKVQIIAAL
jgi:hypothetical protein